MAIRKQSEASFQAQVIQLARLLHWRVAHFRRVRVQRKNGSTYYETPAAADGSGWPDLAMVRGPRLVFAELKAERGRFTSLQLEWLDDLAATGAEVYWWKPSDWDRIQEVLT